MRTFRLIGMTLLMVILAVNFTACSDEEEEQTIIEQANLIGKWQSTWEKIHKVENGKEVVTSDEAYTNGLREFKADGTCTLTATKLVLAFEDWDNLDDGSLELDDITTTTYKKID